MSASKIGSITDLRGRLHDAIADRRDRERPPLLALPGFGMNTRRAGSGRQRPSFRSAASSSSSLATPYCSTSAMVCSVDAGRATVGAHQLPRPLQNVPAVDLVIERVEPSPGIGLGRPVKRSLQFSDFVLLGGPSHDVALTGPSLCVTHERSSGPSLTARFCCPVGSSGTTAASDALPARRPLPGSSPVIGRDAPTAHSAGRRAGEGLPSSRRHHLNVPRPLRRGVPRGCNSRLFTPSMAFAVTDAARLSLPPPEGGHINDAAGFA